MLTPVGAHEIRYFLLFVSGQGERIWRVYVLNILGNYHKICSACMKLCEDTENTPGIIKDPAVSWWIG